MRTTTTRITITAVALLAVVGLAGCAGAKSSSQPAVTETVTSTPQPSPSATTPAPSTATPTTGTGGSGTATVACSTSALHGALGSTAGGGAAGSDYVSIVLTNVSASACTLQGWPGVSFVGSGNGTQIGAAAKFDTTSTHTTVTLGAHAAASATLRIVQAGNYDASACTPTKADGFRVYPPGQKASLYIADSGLTACAKTSVSLLTVGALQG